MPPEIVQFEDFELDLGRYELRRGDRIIKLEKSPMEVLILLVENQGRLVTREEIIKRLWGDDVFVDTRHGINTAVHKLRTALSDDPDQPRILETVVGKGYRLVALTVRKFPDPPRSSVPVHVEAEAIGSAEAPKTGSGISRWNERFSVKVWAGWIALAIIVMGISAGGRTFRYLMLGRASDSIQIHSLAVLPFDNLSGDPSKDYFADGFTDELTTEIAEQTGIRVISRTSAMRYKGSRKSLPEIARELKVDSIVEGSVVLSDKQVRITAQLIQASDDKHLWAHRYERDRKDLTSIQSEVADAIASLIRQKTDKKDSAPVRSASRRERYTPETYSLAMECRNLGADFSETAVKQAIQCYERILALDPNCAAAYAQIAFGNQALGLDNSSKALVAAEKAVALDSSLPEGHLALGYAKMTVNRDFAGAEEEDRKALSLNPSYGPAYADHTILLLAVGQTAEAVAEIQKSIDLEPFSGGIQGGLAFLMAGEYGRAIETEESALKFYPKSDRAAYVLGYAYEQKGMFKKALAQYERILPHDENGVFLAAIGRSYALSGDFERTAEVKYKIEHYPPPRFVWPYDAAMFYTALGDKDRAFQWLDKAVKAHDDWLLFLNVDPRLAPLRSDRRFSTLVKRVGLPVIESH